MGTRLLRSTGGIPRYGAPDRRPFHRWGSRRRVSTAAAAASTADAFRTDYRAAASQVWSPWSTSFAAPPQRLWSGRHWTRTGCQETEDKLRQGRAAEFEKASAGLAAYLVNVESLVNVQKNVGRIDYTFETDLEPRITVGMPGFSKHSSQDFLGLFQTQVCWDANSNRFHNTLFHNALPCHKFGCQP